MPWYVFIIAPCQRENMHSACLVLGYNVGFPGDSHRKESACNTGDPGSSSWSGKYVIRSCLLVISLKFSVALLISDCSIY